jgi:glycyl-tRNA synthetase
MTEQLEAAVVAAQDAVTKQGDTVRSLKASVKEGKLQKVHAHPTLLQHCFETV